MGELLLIALGAALVNNFVLVQLLGVCPFISGSHRVETAIGMSLSLPMSRREAVRVGLFSTSSAAPKLK